MLSYDVEVIKRIQSRTLSSSALNVSCFREDTHRTQEFDKMIDRLVYLKAKFESAVSATTPSPDVSSFGKDISSRGVRVSDEVSGRCNSTNRPQKRKRSKSTHKTEIEPILDSKRACFNSVDMRISSFSPSMPVHNTYISPAAIQMTPKLHATLRQLTRRKINLTPKHSHLIDFTPDDIDIVKSLPQDMQTHIIRDKLPNPSAIPEKYFFDNRDGIDYYEDFWRGDEQAINRVYQSLQHDKYSSTDIQANHLGSIDRSMNYGVNWAPVLYMEHIERIKRRYFPQKDERCGKVNRIAHTGEITATLTNKGNVTTNIESPSSKNMVTFVGMKPPPGCGRAVCVRETGSTVRDNIDIDSSQIVCRLQLDDVVHYDRTALCPPPDSDCIAVTRLRIYVCRAEDTSENDRNKPQKYTLVKGWVSLTGRVYDDTDPIMEIISKPKKGAAEQKIDDDYPLCVINSNECNQQHHNQDLQSQSQQQQKEQGHMQHQWSPQQQQSQQQSLQQKLAQQQQQSQQQQQQQSQQQQQQQQSQQQQQQQLQQRQQQSQQQQLYKQRNMDEEVVAKSTRPWGTVQPNHPQPVELQFPSISMQAHTEPRAYPPSIDVLSKQAKPRKVKLRQEWDQQQQLQVKTFGTVLPLPVSEQQQQIQRQQERLQQERLQQERLQQERLQHERLQQERLQQERLKQERLQQQQRQHEQTGSLDLENKTHCPICNYEFPLYAGYTSRHKKKHVDSCVAKTMVGDL